MISTKCLIFISVCLTGVYCQNSSNMTTSSMTTMTTPASTTKGVVYCSTEKKIPNCVPPPQKPDPFAGLNQNVVKVARALLMYAKHADAKNDSFIASKAVSNNGYSIFLVLVDAMNDQYWKMPEFCPVTDTLRRFLENDLKAAGLASQQRESVLVIERYNKTLFCKRDCNFDDVTMLKKNPQSSFLTLVNDSSAFAKMIMPLMNPRVQSQCRNTIAMNLTAPKDATEVLADLSLINLLPPNKLNNFSKSDSLEILKALSTSGKKLDKESTRSLGKNIPKTANAKDLLSMASSIPLETFNQTTAAELVCCLDKMDIENMGKFRKTIIAKKILKEGDATEVKKFLTDNNDKTMRNAVSAKRIEELGIDITTIPAKNLPKSTLQKYAQTQLATTTLDAMSDSMKARVLKGIKKSSLANVADNKKITTIVSLVNASLVNEVALNSNQRRFFRDSLLAALVALNGSNPEVYLKRLTTDQVKILYPLFIEASSTILDAFSKTELFSLLVAEVIAMPEADCCKYIRESRKTFTKYAYPLITTNVIPTYADLISMGSCLASTLPLDKLSTLNSTDFFNFYTTVGMRFQPDSSEAAIVSTKLTEVGAGYDKEEFVFNKLGDLALFYAGFSGINPTEMKDSGAALVSSIMETRNINDGDTQLCRLGMSNTDTQNRLATIGKSFVDAYIASMTSKRRRKRSVAPLTCDDVNNMAGSLNSIPAANLDTMTTAEFTSCMGVLGSSTNLWTAAQLSSLATLTKNKYTGGINTIPDSEIASLSTILYGFTSAELAQLVFTISDGVSALGTLSDWTTSQLTSGLKTPVKTYLALNSLNMTVEDIEIMKNLVCTLETADSDQVTTAIFDASISTLSKISCTCPNLNVWYEKAKAGTYGALIFNDTSAITELGAVMGGISTSDLAKVSSEDMSSLSTDVWAIMPASTVNTLSASQLKGLSAEQVNGIQNSPNYASFSGDIKSAASSLSSGGAGDVSVIYTSGSIGINYSFFNLVLSTCAALFLFKMA